MSFFDDPAVFSYTVRGQGKDGQWSATMEMNGLPIAAAWGDTRIEAECNAFNFCLHIVNRDNQRPD